MELADYYKKRRRRQFIGRTVIFSGGLLLILFIVWGFFWIPFLRVTQIKVYNYPNEEGVKNAIKPYLESRNKIFLPKNSFWLLSALEMEVILKSKDFGAPEVKKIFPRGLSVSFPEILPWLIFCPAEGACFYVANSGKLGDRAPRFSENPLPEIFLPQKSEAKIGDKIISEGEAGFLMFFLKALKNMSAVPEKIEISSGGIKIRLKEGWFILASTELSPEKAAGDLKLLLEQKIGDKRQELEYIDMRFPNKVFYKLKAVNQN